MRKNLEYSENKKRLYDQDRKILNTIEHLLFNEIANTLNASFEEILQQVEVTIENSVELVEIASK